MEKCDCFTCTHDVLKQVRARLSRVKNRVHHFENRADQFLKVACVLDFKVDYGPFSTLYSLLLYCTVMPQSQARSTPDTFCMCLSVPSQEPVIQ